MLLPMTAWSCVEHVAGLLAPEGFATSSPRPSVYACCIKRMHSHMHAQLRYREDAALLCNRCMHNTHPRRQRVDEPSTELIVNDHACKPTRICSCAVWESVPLTASRTSSSCAMQFPPTQSCPPTHAQHVLAIPVVQLWREPRRSLQRPPLPD